MEKRDFMTLAGLTGLALSTLNAPARAQTQPAASAEPVLLTVTGAVGKPNRGALDHALDQMMAKQGIEFKQATTFTASSLAKLPAISIRPKLEYDSKPH